MGRLLQIGVVFVVVALLFAIVDFAMNPSGSPLRTSLVAIRDTAVESYQALTGHPPAKPEPPKTEAPTSPRRTTAAPAKPRGAEPLSTASAPVAASPPVAVPAPSAPPATSSAPVPANFKPSRRSLYMPGNRSTWASYDVPVTSALVIRAAGRLVAGGDASGPDGLARSADDRSTGEEAAMRSRVLPSVPYLALIGRVCDGDRCSDPFFVGSNFVVCPADVKINGRLQLWTNNYSRLDGRSTTAAYSTSLGGYSFDIEPASDDLCATAARRSAPASARDAAVLLSGQPLQSDQFSVSSSQSTWKPFFVPLAGPLLLRASGTMQPHTGAKPTGPEGIVVPSSGAWSYPGARDVVVDAANQLVRPDFPYQALIGRLCGGADCTAPFLVGRSRVLCPVAPHNERLELWINHIIRPAGLLSSQMPVSLDAFVLQARQGQYRFELTSAPPSACAK